MSTQVKKPRKTKPKLQISISGLQMSQRLMISLVAGESLRVGRTPKHGQRIPWDQSISREHADLTIQDGQLHVQCLETARNPIIYNGEPAREALISTNQWFQIGDTTFHISAPLEEDPDDERVGDATLDFLYEENSEGTEIAFSSEALRKFAFRNTQRQMELLERLPEKISSSHSDATLMKMLSELLLEAIPHALAVAVAHFDLTELPADVSQIHDFPKPLSLRLQTRSNFDGQFLPSRRMILKCLKTEANIQQVFDNASDNSYTASEGLGWAFCVPIKGESTKGWCLYVAGAGGPQKGLIVTDDELVGDLRFTQLVAQFIGSIRQVRMLQEQKTQLSSFFSPKVIESLSQVNSKDYLNPIEREISVLFCDVRGFSKIAESLQEELLTLLKSVSAALGKMAKGILDHDGTIADFQGDAALGFWGWPMELEQGPIAACRSALSIYESFKSAAVVVEGSLARFSIGIGISHGRALAGQIGTNHQAKIGVFGPVVNQGSRLESLTKQLGVPICIDERTADFAKRFLPPTEARLRRLARVRPKGMDSAVTIFGLLPASDPAEMAPELLKAYDTAVDAVIKGKWDIAEKVLRQMPKEDGPSQFLLTRMAEKGNQPPSDWDGAFCLASK